MPRLEKNTSILHNFCLHFLPPVGKKDHKLRGIWQEAIKSSTKITKHKIYQASTKDLEEHPATSLALKILFPGVLKEEMIRINNLPETTLEDKILKEKSFRNMVLKTFECKQIINDQNCGLRALVSALNREIDSESEAMAASILRGDIVDHVHKNPETFRPYLEKEEKITLDEWKKQMATSKRTIGIFEIWIMSQILENPIYVFSFGKTQLDTGGQWLSSTENTFGTEYNKAPISLYYNPISTQYMPMFKTRRS